MSRGVGFGSVRIIRTIDPPAGGNFVTYLEDFKTKLGTARGAPQVFEDCLRIAKQQIDNEARFWNNEQNEQLRQAADRICQSKPARSTFYEEQLRPKPAAPPTPAAPMLALRPVKPRSFLPQGPAQKSKRSLLLPGLLVLGLAGGAAFVYSKGLV